MKIILYIDTMQYGGANRVMANLANYFSSLSDNRVILINDIECKNEKEYILNDKIERYYLDKDITNKFMRKQIQRIKMLRKIVKNTDADVILSFMGPPNYRMLISTMGLSIKKCVSVRNDPYREYGKGIRRIIANIIFLLSDGYILQTEDAAKYFVKNIQKKSKIIFNPVNEKFYSVKRDVEEKRIVMVGRLQKQKNFELAIRAFAKVHRLHADYKLCIYGEGELKPKLKKLALELNISNFVEFLGQVSDIEKKLSNASLFLLTSDFEGMPNALMEAMAVGVPVISTDCPCGGPRTLIENEMQGILVPCNQCDALANAIDKVLDDNQLRNVMRINCKKRAEEFLPIKIFEQWDNYLRRM